MEKGEQKVVLHSEDGRKLNFELVVIVRCLGVCINLRMCIFLHKALCISWIESLLKRTVAPSNKMQEAIDQAIPAFRKQNRTCAINTKYEQLEITRNTLLQLVQSEFTKIVNYTDRDAPDNIIV